MKKLLAILTSTTLGVGATTPVVESIINNNISRHDPISRDRVTAELQKSAIEIEKFNKEDASVPSNKEIMDIFSKAILGLWDISDKEFFQRYLDDTWVLFGHYSSRLDGITVQGPEGPMNYRDFISQSLNEIQESESYIFQGNYLSQYRDYKKAEYKESQLYFEFYNQFITGNLLDTVNLQNQVNLLNEENIRLNGEIKGLEELNGIYTGTLDVLDQTLEFINIFYNQFKASFDNVQKSFNNTSKDHGLSWTAWIPFGGAIFALVYQDDFKKTIENMKFFNTAFVDKNSDGYKEMEQFNDKANSALDEISSLGDEGTISAVVKQFGLDKLFEGDLGKLFNTITGSFSVIEQSGAMGSWLDFLGKLIIPIFMVNDLDNKFNKLEGFYNNTFYRIVKGIIDEISSSKNELNNSIKQIHDSVSANNDQIKDDYQKIDENNNKIKELNKKIDENMKKQETVEREVTETLVNLASVNHMYYWKASKMLVDNDNITKYSYSVTTIKERYEMYNDSIKEERIKYEELIKVIGSSAIETKMKNQLISHHKVVDAMNKRFSTNIGKFIV